VPDASDPTPLPPALAIAWGRTKPATRGPRAGLTAAAIVRAAIDIADADGLAAVSMSRVAEHLGYTPMSLYRHVPSKDDLLALAQDEAFGDPPDLAPADAGRRTDHWRAGLTAWARDLLAAYSAHLWLLDIPIAGPPAMPRSIAWFERALTVLADTPLTHGERLSVVLLLSGYSRGRAQLMRDLERGRERSGLDEDQVVDQYGRVLARLVTPDRFPALHAALHDGLFTAGGADGREPGSGDDEEFEFGLQRILDGVEAHIAAR
jgi:AcrR family transcriptional regulator